MPRENNIRPFSIIELVCVIGVIMLLVGISVKLYSNYIDSMNNGRTRALITQLTAGLQAYKLDSGFYPSNTTAYPTLPVSSSDTSYYFKINLGNTVDTPLIKYFDYQRLKGTGTIMSGGTYEYFKDAWGKPLLYKSPGQFNDTMFDIGSLGKDGKYGDNSNSPNDYGKGDDITNFN